MAIHSSIFAMGNPIDRGGWWAPVHGVAKSQTQLSMHIRIPPPMLTLIQALSSPWFLFEVVINWWWIESICNTVGWLTWGFPGSASGKEFVCQCKRHKRCWFNPWVWKIPWRKAGQPIPIFLPGESHGQRSLAGYSPCGHKESDTSEVT